ncbi:unnamed protein product [Toxocara canis]|uniref:Secreted protein n=1 Tax=Toxocara canis TaxID=6265 RepID=A0A183V5P6_TOXCA|nr:unnamed protein product [Toxocara canis]
MMSASCAATSLSGHAGNCKDAAIIGSTSELKPILCDSLNVQQQIQSENTHGLASKLRMDPCWEWKKAKKRDGCRGMMKSLCRKQQTDADVMLRPGDKNVVAQTALLTRQERKKV